MNGIVHFLFNILYIQNFGMAFLNKLRNNLSSEPEFGSNALHYVDFHAIFIANKT